MITSVTTEEDRRRARLALDRVVLSDRRLPERVFAPHLDNICWLVFDDVLVDELVSCLRHNFSAVDECFYAICLDPGCLENFGHDGIARFELDPDPTGAYHRFLDTGLPETPAITMRHIAERIALVGDSGQWALLADRDRELTIAARSDHAEWARVAGVHNLTFDQMLSVAAGPYRGALPQAQRDQYLRNYALANSR